MEILVISEESKRYNLLKLFKLDTQEKINRINKNLRKLTIEQIKERRSSKVVRREKRLIISRMFFNRKLKILEEKINKLISK